MFVVILVLKGSTNQHDGPIPTGTVSLPIILDQVRLIITQVTAVAVVTVVVIPAVEEIR